MITGKEPIYPTTDSNYINNSDDTPTVGLYGGINLKQHMMIEFTKAIISASLTNNTAAQKLHDNSEKEGIQATEYSAIMADEYATALIKQFNK